MAHRCHDEYAYHADLGAEEPAPPVEHPNREDPWGEEVVVALPPNELAHHHHGTDPPLLPAIVEDDAAYGSHHRFSELLVDDPGAEEPAPPAVHDFSPSPHNPPQSILRSRVNDIEHVLKEKEACIDDDPGSAAPPRAREQADPWCDVLQVGTSDPCHLHLPSSPRQSPPGKNSTDLFLAPLVEDDVAPATTRARTVRLDQVVPTSRGSEVVAPPDQAHSYRQFFNNLVDEEEENLGTTEPPPPREPEKDPWEDLTEQECHRQLHHYQPDDLPPPTSSASSNHRRHNSEPLLPIMEEEDRFHDRGVHIKTYVTWFRWNDAPKVFTQTI